MVPWFRLHVLNIEGFERNQDRTVTTLEGTENRVEIDWQNRSYSVYLNGAEVARQDATFCPLGPDRIAMYSIADGPLTATLPIGWDPGKVTGFVLSTDGKAPLLLQRDGRRVTVQMHSRKPVILYRTNVS
jgi:hypothetical protein